MGLASIIRALKQSYRNNGWAKVAAEGSSDVSQQALGLNSPLLVEASTNAALGALPNALQIIPGASFSPSLLNRGRAFLNSAARLFPEAFALTAAGNVGQWIGDRITEGQNIKEQRNRDIAFGVLASANNGGIPDKWLPNREWVDRGMEYAEYLKSLAPPPNASVPSSNFYFPGNWR